MSTHVYGLTVNPLVDDASHVIIVIDQCGRVSVRPDAGPLA
jgi:hypothetical protein